MIANSERKQTMKKQAIRTLIVLCLGIFLVIPSFAAHEGHGTSNPAEKHHGQKIREAKVEGYELEYNLIDMREAMSGMKEQDMAKMKSHHLMVYLKEPDRKYVRDAKVGFWLVGPDGKDQKTMAMAMGEGFGADIDLKAKTTYKIKTKAVVGDKTLMDAFSYSVK
jgi:hypothetical protein